MLDWFVDELVLDVLGEVLHKLDVTSVEQLANALLNSLRQAFPSASYIAGSTHMWLCLG